MARLAALSAAAIENETASACHTAAARAGARCGQELRSSRRGAANPTAAV
ncbi:hypothetical protein [Streptomyces sp. CdTB01]